MGLSKYPGLYITNIKVTNIKVTNIKVSANLKIPTTQT